MASTHSQLGGAANSPNHSTALVVNSNYRGRVRTGCLTCRARKVKCDEQRPSCSKCTRRKRTCIYKKCGGHQTSSKHVDSLPENRAPQLPQSASGRGHELSSRQDLATDIIFQESPCFLDEAETSHLSASQNHRIPRNTVHLQKGLLSPASTDTLLCSHAVDLYSYDNGFDISKTPSAISPITSQEPHKDLLSPASTDALLSNHGDDLYSYDNAIDILKTPSALSIMTSQDIYLTTTIDLLAATEESVQLSFPYFVEEVDPPLISPYDHVNWRRMKFHFAKLATDNKAIAAAILAVQALYKAEFNGLPTSYALTAYRSAKAMLDKVLEDDTQDFDIILSIVFLLSLIETTAPDKPEECGSILSQPDGAFVKRLATWSLEGQQSAVSLRIESWLRIINTATRRRGGPGLLCETVISLLPNHSMETPSLYLLDECVDAPNPIYESLSAPIFTFYLELQKISNQFNNLSHYHRSRITSADQEEVSEVVTRLKNKISFMWQTRPGPMRLKPGELRAQLPYAIAEPIISLVGVCTAAYHSEIVSMGRLLSDPPLASPEAKQAMAQIRDIIESDWNASNGGKLSPGYLRPVFMYAIESMNEYDTQWAVEQLRNIQDPICRSDFFASFAKSLTEAQLRKKRRVTTRYFCYQTFGQPPPFM